MTKSEAERHLNFNPLPNDETQKKIDYFITPYNNAKVVTKFMNFNEKDNFEQVGISSHYKWKKISGMILNQDKYSLRNTLSTINDKLYKTIDHALRMKNSKKVSIPKKRVKFMTSQVGDQDTRKSARLHSSPERVRKIPRNRASSLFVNKVAQYKNQAPRKSIISTVLDGIRQPQGQLLEESGHQHSNQAHNSEIVRLFKRSKSVTTLGGDTVFNSLHTQNNAKNTYPSDYRGTLLHKLGREAGPAVIGSVQENDDE